MHMAITPSPFRLDPYRQTMVDLWHAASLALDAAPASDDIMVQAAGQAVVAWLRQDAPTPGALLDTFSRPGGPLVPQLRFVGSLVHDPARALPADPPRLWWWVVAAAYHQRWLELTGSPTSRPSESRS